MKVYLRANISLSGWHLSSLERGLRTLWDMFVKRLVDKYRRELIKPSINRRNAPSVCFITCPASSCGTDFSSVMNDGWSKRWYNRRYCGGRTLASHLHIRQRHPSESDMGIKSQAEWFSDNISLIQSQHIYIHSGFKPIIVSVRSNSLKVIALGPHTKEKLFCWVWVLFHFVCMYCICSIHFWCHLLLVSFIYFFC